MQQQFAAWYVVVKAIRLYLPTRGKGERTRVCGLVAEIGIQVSETANSEIKRAAREWRVVPPQRAVSLLVRLIGQTCCNVATSARPA